MEKEWVYEGSQLWYVGYSNRRKAEEATCPRCNKTFFRICAKEKKMFCSDECRHDRVERIEVACSQCGKILKKTVARLRKVNFCCKSCQDAYWTKNVKDCLNCGAKTRWKKFCSHQCQRDFAQKIYIQRWLNGQEDGMAGSDGLSDRINKYLREQRGNQCEKCGWKEVHPVTGRVPITVNHIDGHHTNNHINNLELLCPNCHSLTPTYGSLNIGNGRPYGRKHGRERYVKVAISHNCLMCQKEFIGPKAQKYCSQKCRGLSQRRAARPTSEEMDVLLKQGISWTELASRYNVTDSAVRKWARTYGIAWQRGKRKRTGVLDVAPSLVPQSQQMAEAGM